MIAINRFRNSVLEKVCGLWVKAQCRNGVLDLKSENVPRRWLWFVTQLVLFLMAVSTAVCLISIVNGLWLIFGFKPIISSYESIVGNFTVAMTAFIWFLLHKPEGRSNHWDNREWDEVLKADETSLIMVMFSPGLAYIAIILLILCASILLVGAGAFGVYWRAKLFLKKVLRR